MALRIYLNKCIRCVTCPQCVRYESTNTDSKSLIGRDLIDLHDYAPNEIKDLIWTALDLKSLASADKCAMTNLLVGKSVGMLLKRPCIKTQFAVPTAVAMLGGHCNVFIDDWEKGKSISDIGRFVGSQCDVLFSLGDSQCLTVELANGSPAPVVSILSDTFTPFKCLIDLMTLVEYFGRLRKLAVGYIGPHSALFNTYLTTLPRLGVDFKFTGTPTGDGGIKDLMHKAYKYGQKYNTEIHECTTSGAAAYRVDAVATAFHHEPKLHISMTEMEQANVDWVFLHSMPRTQVEVSDEVFAHKQSLVWTAVENTRWMAMAVVLRLLQDYKPKMERPDFESENRDLLKTAKQSY